MKTLVTGAAGMLGSAVCEAMAGKHDVVATDVRGDCDWLPGECKTLDVTDADAELLRAERQMLRAVVDHAIGIARLEARIAAPLLRRAGAGGRP